MRHLRVPSAKTAFWVERCKENNWYELGSGVLPLGDQRGIPLNDSAPPISDAVWDGFEITEEVGTLKKTSTLDRTPTSQTFRKQNNPIPSIV